MNKKTKKTKKSPKKTKFSFEADVQKVKDHIASGKLETSVSKLDPKNIKKSFDTVPIEIIRLLSALFSSEKNEKQVSTLKPDEREPLEKLIALAEKYKGREFVNQLILSLSKDASILDRLGFPIDRFSITKREGKVHNTITKLEFYPLMMLTSCRLYAEVGFFQDEELLFRSTMEIHELFGVAAEMIGIIEVTLNNRSKNAKSSKPNIDHDRCETFLKSIRENIRLVSSGLTDLAKPTKAKAKKKKRSTKSKSQVS